MHGGRGGGRSAERTTRGMRLSVWTAWSFDRRKVIEWAFLRLGTLNKRRAFDMRIHPQTSGARDRLSRDRRWSGGVRNGPGAANNDSPSEQDLTPRRRAIYSH